MNQLFKRLGALLLVFAMVVGMLPVSVFATNVPGETDYSLVVRLLKIDRWAQWKAEGEQGERPEPRYAYQADLGDSEIENREQVKYYWHIGYTTMKDSVFLPLNENDLSLDTYYSDKNESVAVRVHVDGMIQVAAVASDLSSYNAEGIAKGDSYIWHPTTMLETVYVGVPFELPAPTFYEKGISAAGEGLKIKTVDTLMNSEVFKQVDGTNQYVVDSPEHVGRKLFVTREIYAGMAENPPLKRYIENVEVNIALPELDVKVNGKDAGSYLGAEAIENFVVSFQGDAAQQWFPEVKFNDAVQNVQWTNDNGIWTATIAQGCANGKATVSVGNETWNFSVDTQGPAVEIVSAYKVKGSDKVKVHLNITAGASPVNNVTVNGTSLDVNVVEGSLNQVFECDVTENVVEVIATNSLSNRASATKTVNDELEFVVTGGPTVENGCIQKDEDYVISFKGLGNGIILESLSPDEHVRQDDGVYKVDSAYVNNVTMTATDSEGRTAKYPFPALEADNEGPSVSVKRSTPKTYISAKDTQYVTLTAQDAGSGVADGAEVTYEINGINTTIEFKNGVAEIPVKENEKLAGYTITGLQDKLGNPYGKNDQFQTEKLVVDTTAPNVTVTLSPNVKSVVEFDDQIFLILDPVEDRGEATDENKEDVWIKVQMTDDYLTEDDQKSLTFTPSASVPKHETAHIRYDFTLKDAAGNAVNSITLEVKQRNGTSLTKTITTTDGVFSGLLAVDRRMPSGIKTGIPDVEIVPVAEPEMKVPHATAGADVALYAVNQFAFEAIINDESQSGYDSGVAKVEPRVTGKGLTVAQSLEGDKYTFTVTAKDENETNEGALHVEVRDKAGNGYTFTRYFCVDRKAPQATMTLPTPSGENGDTYYYQANATVTTKVEDLFLKSTDPAANIESVNGVKTAKVEQGVSTLAEIGTIQVYAIDLADHPTSVSNDKKLVVDESAPEFSLLIQDENGNKISAGKNYTGKLTYVFSVEDANLIRNTMQLKYTIVGEGGTVNQEYTVSASEFTEDNTYTVTVPAHHILSTYEISASDYSGRSNTKTIEDTEKVLVDSEHPVLSVAVSSEDKEPTGSEILYYQSDVTYTVTIKDETLNHGNAAYAMTYSYKDSKGQSYVKSDEKGKWTTLASGDKGLQYSVVLGDGEILTGMTVSVIDAAGYTAVLSADTKDFVRDEDDATVYAYNGKQVVVDSTSPKADLTFSVESSEEEKPVELDGFYTKESGMNYLKLKTSENRAGAVNVTVTLDVTDRNLYAEGLKTIVENDGTWTLVNSEVNSDNGKATYTKTVTVYDKTAADITLKVNICDMAGNKLVVNSENVKVQEVNGKKPVINEPQSTEGKFVVDMIADYRQPGSENDENEPVILVSYNPSTNRKNGDVPLFKHVEVDGKLVLTEVNAIITDTKKGTNDADPSGLNKVTYSISDSEGVVSGSAGELLPGDGGYAKLGSKLTLAGKDGESNNVVLNITAIDNAGNAISRYETIGVDTLKPRITATYVNEDTPKKQGNKVDEIWYFNADRVLNLTLTDLNTDLDKTIIDTTGKVDEKWTTAGIVSTKTVGFGSGVHNFSITSTDLAGNETPNAEVTYTGNGPTNFIIDKDKPVIEITRSFAGKQFTDGATDYLNQDVTYNFKVTDQYLDSTNLNGQVVEIRYTINGEETVIALGSEKAPAYEEVGGMDVYTYSFTLTDGDVLSALSVKAVDNAKNEETFNMTEGETDKAGNIVFHKGHNTVIVDMTAPVVNLVRSSTAAKNQAANGYDFYNNEVTYTFTVTDTNLNGSSTGFANAAAYTITVNGVTAEPNAFAWSNDGSKMTAQFTVTDGQTLDTFNLQIKDAAGNPAKLVGTQATVGDADAFTTADAAEGKFVYAGNPVVVDRTAPTAHLTVVSDPADELLNYYTDANGVCYVKLKNPTKNNTAENEVTVKLQLEVTDRNLTAIAGHTGGLKDNKDNTNKNWAKGAGSWSENYLVNNNGTAVYTRTVTVKPDKTGQIIIDLNVEDLAGNKIAPAITMESINGTTPANNPLKADNGNVKGILTLDRRQPTTGNDTAAPYISVVPSITNISKTKDGTVLYNSGLDFELVVTDGANNTLNAGLKPNDETGMGSVTWKLTNDAQYNGSFVKASGAVKGTENDTHNHKEIITVAAGEGECNHFELTVTAVDNVGNTIVYTEVFAIDTQAPRITVSYDNNDVRNEKYFKADRVATVTVEDINFNSSTTKIDTEINGSGWVQSSDRIFVSTYVYNTDGDYTFKMSSSDLAKNITANEGVKYQGVATDAFTIDKTAPVIELKYDPSDMSKTDADKTVYYAVDQNVSVEIKEHNFRAADVMADFYINRDNPLAKTLGNFTSNGDLYTAKAVFDQGNRYRMTVDYTDLAGNPAEHVETHIFSVDKTPPTITITNPDMNAGTLNVVPGELELGFKIEDGQNNLKKYQVVITHLNNAFETKTYQNIEKDKLEGDGRKSITINLDDIEQIKVNDGLYTVQVIGWDYADNRMELTPELVFSLNRFGSTFTTEDAFTKQFLTPGSDGVVYHSSVDGNLIFQEINPNRVFSDETMKDEGSSLTIIVNGRSVRLNKGTDYTVKVAQQGEGEHKWYVYTYEIDKSVFQSEGDLLNGRYSILIYGVDEAANDNTNEGNEFSAVQVGPDGEYSGKIEFVLDNKAPVIITTGIDSGEVYNEEYRRMEIEISDSTPAIIQVYLNEELVPLSTDPSGLSNDQPWLVQDETTGIYTLNVNEQNGIFASQTVRVEAKDAAGNTAEAEVTEFHVSTSFIVRMINSVWFYVALVSVGAAGIFLVIKTRKKVAV